MTISKDYSISFVAAALVVFNLFPTTIGQANENHLQFSISPSTIEVGERASLEIRLKRSDSQEQQLRLDDSLLTQDKKLTLLHSEQRDEPGFKVWRFDFTSYQTGTISVPPLQIKDGPNTYSTERRDLTVSSTRQESDQELREDFPTIWPPLPWRKALLILIGAVALIGLIIYLYRKFRRMPKRQWRAPAIPLPIAQIDSLIWLRNELARLKARAETTDDDTLLDDYTFTIRKYLYLKYNEPYPSRTTFEIKRELARYQGLSPILEPFQQMDQIKFSQRKVKSAKPILLFGIQTAEKLLCGT